MIKGVRKMEKWLYIGIASMIFMAGPAFAGGYAVQKNAGDYAVDIRMDRNPPVVGANQVEVAVKDKSGKDVTDAKVQVIASMPAMPGMPSMENKADAKIENGKYKAKIDLSMGGSWNMSIRITQGGKTTTAKFTVDAR
jgi:hypothetical protein